MTTIHDEVPRGERQAMIDEIEELRAEIAMLKTSWGLAKDTKIISASDNSILVDQPPSGTRVRLSMACPKQFDKQREALELCRELAEACHCFFNQDHGDLSDRVRLGLFNADESRFDKALAEYARARKAVEECLQ